MGTKLIFEIKKSIDFVILFYRNKFRWMWSHKIKPNI